MTFNDLSDYDIILLRSMMYAFSEGFRPAIFLKRSLSFDRGYLENITKKVVSAELSCSLYEENSNTEYEEDLKTDDLECDLIYNQWWAFDPRYAGVLNKDEVKVVIIAIEEALKYFDGDISAIIGEYDVLQALKHKLEALLVVKDFMCLQWSEFKYYIDIQDNMSSLNLKFLIYFFSNDYRPNNFYRTYDRDLLIREVSFYDGTFVYNDLENKVLYVGIAEWEFDEDIKAPSLEEFPEYINEINSCKISHDNWIELTEKMLKLKDRPAPFAVIYRDNSDWIRCKGFSFEEELKTFPENY